MLVLKAKLGKACYLFYFCTVCKLSLCVEYFEDLLHLYRVLKLTLLFQ